MSFPGDNQQETTALHTMLHALKAGQRALRRSLASVVLQGGGIVLVAIAAVRVAAYKVPALHELPFRAAGQGYKALGAMDVRSACPEVDVVRKVLGRRPYILGRTFPKPPCRLHARGPTQEARNEAGDVITPIELHAPLADGLDSQQ